MAVTMSTLSTVVIIIAYLACETCSASAVYVKYSRKVPSKFSGDKYVEEVVEEFDMPQRPPMFGHRDEDINNILKAGFRAGMMPVRPVTRRPGTRPYGPEWPIYPRPELTTARTTFTSTYRSWFDEDKATSTSTTTQRSLFNWFNRGNTTTSTTTPRSVFNWFNQGDTTSTTTTTPRSGFNWFDSGKTSTSTTTSTTQAPVEFTTNPYENQNPDYSNIIPTITAEVIPPSSTPRVILEEITTTEKIDDVEYYDNNEEIENDKDGEEKTTGPTKVKFPSFSDNDLNGNGGDADNAGNPLQQPTNIETTTEAFNGEDEDNYEDNYDYEDEKEEADKDEETPVNDDATKMESTTVAPTAKNSTKKAK